MRGRTAAFGMAAAVVLSVGGVAMAGQGSTAPTVERLDRAATIELLTTAIAAATDPDAGVSPAECVAGPGDLWLAPAFIAPGVQEVECSIPSGVDLAVNLGGTLCWPSETTPPAGIVAECRRAERGVPSMQTVLVDGRAQREPAPAGTGEFSVVLAEGNVFGLDPGSTPFAYVGRNVAVRGLSDGEHVIRLLYTFPNGRRPGPLFDVTYRIAVGG